jgi:hypothetical protein
VKILRGCIPPILLSRFLSREAQRNNYGLTSFSAGNGQCCQADPLGASEYAYGYPLSFASGCGAGGGNKVGGGGENEGY